jgi:hypothetical protein
MFTAMASRLPTAPQHRWRIRLGLLSLGTAVLVAGPAMAGSVTADSVWDQNDARQRALEQMPAGSTVTGTRCEVISVGMGNDRYRCTVEYSSSPLR